MGVRVGFSTTVSLSSHASHSCSVAVRFIVGGVVGLGDGVVVVAGEIGIGSVVVVR